MEAKWGGWQEESMHEGTHLGDLRVCTRGVVYAWNRRPALGGVVIEERLVWDAASIHLIRGARIPWRCLRHVL
jgi:hypothetical protein